MPAGQLAQTIAVFFTGAAIYINIVEQPGRLELDNRSLLAEWKLADKRGYVAQASLVIVGGLFGLGCPYQHLRLALGARSQGPAGELALYDLRNRRLKPPGHRSRPPDI